MNEADFVTAIITNEQNQVLMIYVQGDTDPQPYWSLPGGRVESSETVEAALVREVLEETGIRVLDIGPVAYLTDIQFDDCDARAIVFHITEWEGTPQPSDPEEEIIDAMWIALEQAIQYLQKIDYAPMSTPPVAYLSKEAPAGKHWQYRVNENGAKWLTSD